MEPRKLKHNHPEATLQANIIKMLESRGWVVRVMTASKYLSGLADLYCTHKKYGSRWIEVKLPDMKGSRWTPAQREWFPIFSMNGTPIWVLTGAKESDYKLIFGPENWFFYMLIK